MLPSRHPNQFGNPLAAIPKLSGLVAFLYPEGNTMTAESGPTCGAIDADFGTPNGPPILDALWATRE